MTRWTPARKLEVVLAFAGGMSMREVSATYGVEPHEVDAWCDRYARHGEKGLHVQKLQVLR